MGARLRLWWQQIKQHPFIATGIIAALLALIAFALAVYKFGWSWTGFTSGGNKITITSTSKAHELRNEVLSLES